MALELGVHNIRVNSISPGLFKSEITEGLMQKDWLNNVALKTVPLRTYGTSDPALTSLVRYLIHDSSEYVSGNMFVVEAGVTLPGISARLVDFRLLDLCSQICKHFLTYNVIGDKASVLVYIVSCLVEKRLLEVFVWMDESDRYLARVFDLFVLA
ncbi:hypothetical protein ACLOJK_008251 [Asimina triloba]